jgi:hypothetical protein
MSAESKEADYAKAPEKTAVGESDVPAEGFSLHEGSDILALQGVDPALNAKMHLVNNVGFPQAPLPPIRPSSCR